MPPLPAEDNKGHNSRTKEVVKSAIKYRLTFMVTNLMY